MGESDMDWVVAQLERFIVMTKLHNLSGRGLITTQSGPSAPNAEVIDEQDAIEAILARFYPRWREENKRDQNYDWAQHRVAAQRCYRHQYLATGRAETVALNEDRVSNSDLTPRTPSRSDTGGSSVSRSPYRHGQWRPLSWLIGQRNRAGTARPGRSDAGLNGDQPAPNARGRERHRQAHVGVWTSLPMLGGSTAIFDRS